MTRINKGIFGRHSRSREDIQRFDFQFFLDAAIRPYDVESVLDRVAVRKRGFEFSVLLFGIMTVVVTTAAFMICLLIDSV